MIVKVRLFAGFRKDRFKEKDIAVPDGTAISDIINLLGIDENEVGIIFINGKHGSTESVLTDCDTASLFPVVGGG